MRSEKGSESFLSTVREYFLGSNIDLETLEVTDDRDTILGLITNDILKNDYNNIDDYFSKVTIDNGKNFINQDSEENNTSNDFQQVQFLGHIEKLNNFYNFEPEYYYDEDGSIKEFDTKERKEKLPERGKINLNYNRRGKSFEFLESLNIDEEYFEGNNSLFLIKINPSYIVENENLDYQRKINLQDIIDSGLDITEIIQPIENLNFYKVVTPKAEVLNADSFSSNIFVNESSYNADSNVLLKYMDKLYGPYLLKIRNIDKEKYINPNAVANNYIVNAFDFSDAIKLRFSREANGNDRFYTDVANIKGISKNGISEDKMPDTILLKKFKDDRNLKSLMDNPDEFIGQCETAAFLKDIPEKIYDSRIERIKKLFSDTVNFDNEQKMILKEMLSTLRDEELNDILGSRIKDTETYKTLQVEMKNIDTIRAEMQTEKDKKEDEISELNILLNEKADELRKLKEQSATKVQQDDSLVNEELKKENEEYKEKEELYNSIEDLKVEINKLQGGREAIERERKKRMMTL